MPVNELDPELRVTEKERAHIDELLAECRGEPTDAELDAMCAEYERNQEGRLAADYATDKTGW